MPIKRLIELTEEQRQELEQAIVTTKDERFKIRCRMVLLNSEGLETKEIAKILSKHRSEVCIIIKRYKDFGIKRLILKNKSPNIRGQLIVSDQQRQELEHLVETDKDDSLRIKCRIILLKDNGLTIRKISKIVGRKASYINVIFRMYKDFGINGLITTTNNERTKRPLILSDQQLQELKHETTTSKDEVFRIKCHIILLKYQKNSIRRIAKIVGEKITYVNTTIKKYKDFGINGLISKPR